jgi:hypothetical protein
VAVEAAGAWSAEKAEAEREDDVKAQQEN